VRILPFSFSFLSPPLFFGRREGTAVSETASRALDTPLSPPFLFPQEGMREPQEDKRALRPARGLEKQPLFLFLPPFRNRRSNPRGKTTRRATGARSPSPFPFLCRIGASSPKAATGHSRRPGSSSLLPLFSLRRCDNKREQVRSERSPFLFFFFFFFCRRRAGDEKQGWHAAGRGLSLFFFSPE